METGQARLGDDELSDTASLAHNLAVARRRREEAQQHSRNRNTAMFAVAAGGGAVAAILGFGVGCGWFVASWSAALALAVPLAVVVCIGDARTAADRADASRRACENAENMGSPPDIAGSGVA